MRTDWLKCANEERRILGDACKRICAEQNLSFEEFAKRAGFNSHRYAPGYADGFWAGRMARKIAAGVYAWLRNHHPEIADEVDARIATLYGASLQSGDWETFVREHGQFGFLKVVPGAQNQIQAQITQIQHEPEPIDRTIALSQPFYVSLESSTSGVGIGLQWVRGRWTLLPIGPGEPKVPIEYGHNRFPRDNHPGISLRDPLLHEEVEAGLHRLVLLVVPHDVANGFLHDLRIVESVPSHTLDRLAARALAAPRHAWRLYRCNVMFVISDSFPGFVATKLDHDEPDDNDPFAKLPR